MTEPIPPIDPRLGALLREEAKEPFTSEAMAARIRAGVLARIAGSGPGGGDGEPPSGAGSSGAGSSGAGSSGTGSASSGATPSSGAGSASSGATPSSGPPASGAGSASSDRKSVV